MDGSARAQCGQASEAKCNIGHIKRFYESVEIKEVMGSYTIDHVRRKFLCEQCDAKKLEDE